MHFAGLYTDVFYSGATPEWMVYNGHYFFNE